MFTGSVLGDFRFAHSVTIARLSKNCELPGFTSGSVIVLENLVEFLIHVDVSRDIPQTKPYPKEQIKFGLGI